MSETETKGFDIARQLTHADVPKIKADGYSWIGRYLSTNNHLKCVTPAELQMFAENNLWCVLVWENGFPISSSYFSYHQGVVDGTNAWDLATNTLKVPSQSTIYFAVDYDASAVDRGGVIHQYFEGIEYGFSTMAVRAVPEDHDYKIGVYGSGATCLHLRNAALVDNYWLAQSKGWEMYNEFLQSGDANIVQGPEINEPNWDIDTDVSNGSSGGFIIKTGG